MYRTQIDVEGMACSMCEAHINEVIRNNLKVRKVSSNRRKKITVIDSEEPIDTRKAKALIEGLGYDVKGFSESVR